LAQRAVCVCALAVIGFVCPAFGQKTVTTTGGTVNVVPKYSGANTIINSAIFENNGNVGIGTTAPTSVLHVVSTSTATSGAPTSSFIQTTVNPGAASSAAYAGLKTDTLTKSGNTQSFSGPLFGSLFAVDHYGSGTVASAYGLEGEVSNRSSGTLSNAYALWLQLQNTGKGAITNGYGLRIGAPTNNGGGHLSNYYGLYVEQPLAAASDFAIYSQGGLNYFGGSVGIGTTQASSPLTVNGVIQSTSGGIKFPDGSIQKTATLQGPPGSQGPQGPAGPSLSLPYTGAANSSSAAIFRIQNNGSGNGIEGDGGAAAANSEGPGAVGGVGVTGYGGAAAVYGVPGGVGVAGYGGSAGYDDDGAPAYGVAGYGGAGSKEGTGAGVGYFQGGSGGVDSGGGGDGVDAIGGGGCGSADFCGGGVGIMATAGSTANGNPIAGIFNGDVNVTGTLSKSAGSFKIDHPLDPANKYLYHSFVESPDMMNIYNGNVTTDGRGVATVTLPDWFEALNKDFRYQLTVIGQFAQAIIGSKIADNRFTIRTDKPGVEVSWQVTGIRQDAYANAHRIRVEQDKPEKERGHYLHPELYGHSDQDSVLAVQNPRFFQLVQKQRAAAQAKSD